MVTLTKSTRVLRITQSPFNKDKWCFDLECGHAQWATMQTKPNKSRMFCRTCDDAKKAKKT